MEPKLVMKRQTYRSLKLWRQQQIDAIIKTYDGNSIEWNHLNQGQALSGALTEIISSGEKNDYFQLMSWELINKFLKTFVFREKN